MCAGRPQHRPLRPQAFLLDVAKPRLGAVWGDAQNNDASTCSGTHALLQGNLEGSVISHSLVGRRDDEDGVLAGLTGLQRCERERRGRVSASGLQ